MTKFLHSFDRAASFRIFFLFPRTFLLVVLSSYFLLHPAAADAAQFTPPANSPLARGEHPRLFVTSADLPQMRAKIDTYYRSDFQNFVTFLDGMFGTAPGSGDIAGWNEIFGAARSYAFLYLIDPGQFSGIQPGHSRSEYGHKALELGLYIAHNLSDSWTEAHHGAKNLTTSDGGLASLALQVVYDWTHDLATLDERRTLAGRLITMWDNRYDAGKVKLENHYAANVHVYAGALCFYRDADLGATYTARAEEMMDGFQRVFLDGQLGVAARLFEGSSDWVEGDSYSLDGFTGIMFAAAAAGSAMGENFFVTNPWLHYAPYFIYYSIMPMPYEGIYYFSQQNTSSVIKVRHRFTSGVMYISAAMLADSDPDLAGFAAWFCGESRYGLPVNSFNYYSPHLFDLFYKFLFGTRQVPKKSPREAGIPLSVHLGQQHVMRSDHGYDDATLVQFFSQRFWYENGHNERENGAFNIHRFGTLAISAANSKNAGSGIPRVAKSGKGMAQNNIFGLGDDQLLDLEMGSMKVNGIGDTPDRFVTGAPEHIGEVEAREYIPGRHDYINYNYTRSYKGGSKASLARRALVYLRGPVNHEYVVVMDRVVSDREKYFLVHTPVDIEAVGGSWNAAGSGHWTTAARRVKVTNRIDRSHGQMYLTSVFPQSIVMHKYGGPGKEWVWADGTKLDYSAGEFTEKASYLLSDHTLQIRSQENLFLTAMQIGDANSMGPPAAVQPLEGDAWFGAMLGGERVVIFSKTENPLLDLSYSISSSGLVDHLITELDRRRRFTVESNGRIVASGSTGPNGTIYFTHQADGTATYAVHLGEPTAIENEQSAGVPTGFAISNFPNPFNPATTIEFTVPARSNVTLAVFNVQGQRVKTLAAGAFAPGTHHVEWDGTNSRGEKVASGVYFSKLQAGNRVVRIKMLLAQ